MFTPPMQNEEQVAPILKQHVDQVTSQVPSFLKEAQPDSPAPILKDYNATGNPALKIQAATAFDTLNAFAQSAKKAVNSGANAILGKSTYTAPPHMDLVANIQDKENQPGDVNALVKNKDGTFDYGLMQINSSMLPFVKDKFATMNRQFNPFNGEDSKLAASLILGDNAEKFRTSLGRAPTDMELISSYNVGINNVIKQAKQNSQGKQADKYMKASIFHPQAP